ncbi:hypothetical protein [Vibrio metschnikovii]|uniref:hypothetical protein n=2 Tax=Vibrio metschnikovii TaxID=28172 RepID=UPI002FC7B7B7
MDKQYSDLGFKILESFQEIFDNSVIESSKEDGVYSVLRFASNLTIKFRDWTEKPYYLILFKGEKYLYEIDLSRVVFENGNYDWYLNKPTNLVNQNSSLPLDDEHLQAALASVGLIGSRNLEFISGVR